MGINILKYKIRKSNKREKNKNFYDLSKRFNYMVYYFKFLIIKE